MQNTNSAKRVAQVKLTLTKRTVDALEPAEKSWIAWDDKLTGFGCRVQPSGTKSFIVNYRPGDGGRRAPNKRVVIGRFGRMAPDEARRKAQDLLGRVARGEDPAGERAEARGVPTLAEAFETYMRSNPNRAANTVRLYRQNLRVNLGDWVKRPLNALSRQDVEDRFNFITGRHGWSAANQTMSMLRSIYRRPCVDHDGLCNPVEQWLAAGGRFNPTRRRRISGPAEVLPRWRAGIEAAGLESAIRDIFLIGLYTGMRRGEVLSLRWERMDLDRRILRVEETKTGEPLELPITKQLGAIFGRLREDCGGEAAPSEGWLFPSPRQSRSGHVADLAPFYAGISEAAGTRFWFHGLRNAFITVAERELMLPRSLTKRLVNHARPTDVTEGYAADWTVEQLREPAQRVADRIDELLE
ncbi:MAG: integrase arm-type DNA-binding domain-containing protein [Paracoccaceae bacterium]|nr:integrase arm-type DNA-binding domain-containing protein [Paracoccaceae bacterium]